MEKAGLLATERGTGNSRIVLSANVENVLCLQLNIRHNTIMVANFNRGYFDFLQKHFLDITE